MQTMKSRTVLWWAICLGVAVTPLSAQQNGAYLFETYCAICHDTASGVDLRAPARDVMKQMTPEHILDVLEKRVMKAQAAERNRAQRRTLAEYLSGKPFGSTPELMPRSASCSSDGSSKHGDAAAAWN